MSANLKLQRSDLDSLFQLLIKQGYEIIGPKVVANAIQFKAITSTDDLPVGLTDVQGAGSYKLVNRDDKALFGYNCGPDSLKNFFLPQEEVLFENTAKADGSIAIKVKKPKERKLAFIGLKACDLAALAILDKVFLQGIEVDEHYKQRRKDILVITTNCTQAGNNCFCVSMNTGPAAESGFDIAITEVVNSKEHFFVTQSDTDIGEKLLQKLQAPSASVSEIEAGQKLIQETTTNMTKKLDSEGARGLLPKVSTSPRWEQIADRCLSCCNCTMSCPTCFCNSTEMELDLLGKTSKQIRKRDSCFNVDFSYTVGEVYRHSVSARYRNWLTHKFSSWFKQFETSGCVGCGRCITWCPVGIDVTEEIGGFIDDAKAN